MMENSIGQLVDGLSPSHRRPIEPVSGNTPQTRPANNAYFPALDGFRALAFILVFATHYLNFPWGFTGVDAFFVLSGFLITGILFDSRDDPNRAYNFYVRRTLRILPLYYGLCLLMVVVYPVFRWEWNWSWLLWPAYLGNFGRFIHPALPGSALQLMADAQPISRTFPRVQLFLGHLWSLCVEEQFYLCWPWVVFWIRDRRKLIYLCVAALVLCPVMRSLAPHMLPHYMFDQLVTLRATPYRLDALLLGGLIALMRRGPWQKLILPVARILFAVLIVAILVWHVTHRASWGSFRAYVYPSWAFTTGLTISEWFYASIIVMALEYQSFACRLFDVRPLRWLGKISYGAYVFHDMLHLLFLRLALHFHWHPIAVTATLAFVTTLVFSWASFRFFESFFIRMKDRLTH